MNGADLIAAIDICLDAGILDEELILVHLELRELERKNKKTGGE